MNVAPKEPATCGSSGIVIPSVDYIQEWSPDLHAKVRVRFGRDLEALTGLGFRELSFYSEQFGLFSSFIGLPMSLAMLMKREVMRLESGLQVRASFVLMSHANPATVALPLALGIKLYTRFTDHTLLISTNFHSCPISQQGSDVIKHSSKRTIGDMWTHHQLQIRELVAGGKAVRSSVGFDDYVEASHEEEAAVSC
jgi:hypothetical protein